MGSSFGPTKYGQPSVPGSATFQNNPSQYQAFNTSPQYHQAAAQIGQNTGQAQTNNLANLAQMGAGRSAGANRMFQDTAATGENQANQFASNADAQSFQQQLDQQNENNQFNLGEQQLQQQQYKESADLQNQETAQRKAALASFGPWGAIASNFIN